MNITIIDLGINNLLSIKKVFQSALGSRDSLSITESFDTNFQKSDLVVIPGVGNFGVAIEKLHKNGLYQEIRIAAQNRKIVGICLGMQMLFDSSEESAGVQGLGLIPGAIKKINRNISSRVPHVGWNSLEKIDANINFLSLSQEKDFYFVHSFHAIPSEKSHILTETRIEDGSVVSSVIKENILGFQFHPEKSGSAGKILIHEVVKWAKDEN